MTDWLGQLAQLPSASLVMALVAVMVLDAIPLVGVLVPGDAAILLALGASDAAQSAGVMLGVVGGSLTGWSVTFFAGRYLGGRIRAGRLGRWIGEDRWATAERVLSAGGARMVMVAPFLPVLNALMPLAAGGLRMPYRRFAGFAAVGAVLWAGLYLVLGAVADLFGELLPQGDVTTIGTVAVGMGLGWLVLLATRRRLAAAVRAGREHPPAPVAAMAPTQLAGRRPPAGRPPVRGRRPTRPHLPKPRRPVATCDGRVREDRPLAACEAPAGDANPPPR